MNAHPHADLIKAWAEGASIQFLDGDNEWKLTARPQWEPQAKYRIAPTMVRYRVAIMRHKGGGYYTVSVPNTRMAETYEKCDSFIQWASPWQIIAVSRAKEAVTS